MFIDSTVPLLYFHLLIGPRSTSQVQIEAFHTRPLCAPKKSVVSFEYSAAVADVRK